LSASIASLYLVAKKKTAFTVIGWLVLVAGAGFVWERNTVGGMR